MELCRSLSISPLPQYLYPPFLSCYIYIYLSFIFFSLSLSLSLSFSFFLSLALSLSLSICLSLVASPSLSTYDINIIMYLLLCISITLLLLYVLCLSCPSSLLSSSLVAVVVSVCVGTWIIEGDELALAIGMVSALSSNPLSLAARALIGGTISNDELPIASPTGVYGCARWGPLVGVLAGTSDPSEIGTSAASVTRVLRRGGPGRLDRPLSFLSISARLVLALMRLLIRGLKDDPSVSAAPRACTCPATRSSPNGRRSPPIPGSTMPLGPVERY